MQIDNIGDDRPTRNVTQHPVRSRTIQYSGTRQNSLPKEENDKIEDNAPTRMKLKALTPLKSPTC